MKVSFIRELFSVQIFRFNFLISSLVFFLVFRYGSRIWKCFFKIFCMHEMKRKEIFIFRLCLMRTSVRRGSQRGKPADTARRWKAGFVGGMWYEL